MSLGSWFYGLQPPIRLAFSIAFGIVCYGFLRWIIYLANKESKSYNLNKPRHLSEKEKLDLTFQS
jgi:hypothetical protein